MSDKPIDLDFVTTEDILAELKKRFHQFVLVSVIAHDIVDCGNVVRVDTSDSTKRDLNLYLLRYARDEIYFDVEYEYDLSDYMDPGDGDDGDDDDDDDDDGDAGVMA